MGTNIGGPNDGADLFAGQATLLEKKADLTGAKTALVAGVAVILWLILPAIVGLIYVAVARWIW